MAASRKTKKPTSAGRSQKSHWKNLTRDSRGRWVKRQSSVSIKSTKKSRVKRSTKAPQRKPTLKKGTPLNQHQYFIPEQSTFTLSKSEIEQLTIFQNTLVNNLLNLLNSQRPDWGSVAFTLYARILSLSLAIDSGTFVFLDSFVADSFSIPYTEVETYKALLEEQKNKALTRIIQEKNQLFTATQAISEKNYSRLEMLSNYYYERERGLAENRSIRVSGEQRLPSKSIPLPDHLFPKLTSKKTEEIHHAND